MSKPSQEQTSSPRWRPLRVACFEADWAPRFDDRQSVLPILELLERQQWIRYFHRRVANADQFLDDARRWATQKQYADFRLAYVAAHGSPGIIGFGRGLKLERLSELNLTGRAIFFSSCSTGDSRGLTEFAEMRAKTRARAVMGFREDVDWIEAAAFDLLLMSWLAEYGQNRTWPIPALKAVYRDYGELVRRLGFVAVWSSGQIPPRRQRSRSG